MSEPENYVKKEEPRVSIKQRRKKSIGGIPAIHTQDEWFAYE